MTKKNKITCKNTWIKDRKNQCIRTTGKKRQRKHLKAFGKLWIRRGNPFDQRWSRNFFDADDQDSEEDSVAGFRWNAFDWQQNTDSVI